MPETPEYISIAERGAERAIRDTAKTLGVPVYRLHKYLDEKSLRQLCISAASDTLAIVHQTMVRPPTFRKHEGEQPNIDIVEGARLRAAEVKIRTFDAPGC